MLRLQNDMPADDLFDDDCQEEFGDSTNFFEEDSLAGNSSSGEVSPRDRRKKNKKQNSKDNRKAKREKMARLSASAGVHGGPNPRQKASEKYNRLTEPIFTDLHIKAANVTATAYTALDNPKKKQKITMTNIDFKKMRQDKKSFRLEELVGEDSVYGFKLVSWDGKYVFILIRCQSNR